MVIKLSPSSVKFLEKCNKTIAGPQNRLILGISALSSQPFIDYFNSHTDKKTRKTSVCKTISRIVVGTTTGILVRALAIKHSAKFLSFPYFKKLFPEILNNHENKKLLQSTIGDILGVGICLFTNFLVDAPLTGLCTNYLTKKFVKENKK